MEIKVFGQFQELMKNTRISRQEIVEAVINEQRPDEKYLMCLLNARSALENIEKEGDKRVLKSEKGKKIYFDLSYELQELNKDIYYLEQNEKTFYRYLESFYQGFEKEVEHLSRELNHLKFHNFITDRDGTVNNYCGRYSTSIQSAYNGIFLTRFARERTQNPIILTSAPLEQYGLVDISVMPYQAFIYAGSKGRELMDREGKIYRYPIEQEKQSKLEALNRRLSKLAEDAEYEIFTRIGSGLQFKFGQTTIARQDIYGSIPPEESASFKEKVEHTVREVDPEKEIFRIEDTGKDLEIILTIETEHEGLKDFDKGDGVLFMDKQLQLTLSKGLNLICGDTPSDVPMVEAAMNKNKNTYAIFVTTDEQLRERVSGICPNSYFVDTPDVLVGVLNNLAKTK